jgi:hypothetical protein
VDYEPRHCASKDTLSELDFAHVCKCVLGRQQVPQPSEQDNRRKPAKGGLIATLSGVPSYDTLRIRVIIQGQRAIALIDGGATHNFIDASLVSRQALQTKEFDVAVADGHTVECLDRIPNLEMKLGNYTVRDTFYVVDLSDIDVVLGVQWMITLGKITTNYQTLEIGFRDQDGKKVFLRGMSTGAPRTVSAKRMERIFRHGEVAYVVECLITTQKDSEGRQQYHTEIKNLLGQHQQVFEAIPPGRPPDKGFEHTIECRNSRSYQQSSWSVFDQAKTLSFLLS